MLLTVVSLLIALILPLAIATDVIVPLYSYPGTAAWSSVITALAANPSLGFTVIINPDSGPQAGSANSDFTTAITELLAYNNAVVIGYVPTGFGDRTVAEINADVDLYASWDAAVRPSGIFFDEVEPSNYVDLASNTAHVKSVLAGGLVVYNPGSIPEAEDADLYTAPDQVVVFESPYSSLASLSGDLSSIATGASIVTGKLSAMVTAYSNESDEAETWSSGLFSGWGSVYLTEDPATYQQITADFSSFCELVAGAAAVTTSIATTRQGGSASASASSHTISVVLNGALAATTPIETTLAIAASGSGAVTTTTRRSRHPHSQSYTASAA